MEKKTSVVKNIRWVVQSIFRYDYKYLFILGAATIIMGLLPPLSTVVFQNIINGLQKRRPLHILVVIVGIYIGIDLLQALLQFLLEYYKYKFSQGYNLHMNQKVLQKASNLSLKSYENSEIYDMISRAQYETQGKLLTYFESFAGIFSSLITTMSYLMIIMRFRVWIVFGIVLIPTVKFLISTRINRETFVLMRERTNDSRKSWYMQYILTYGEAYKELKTYNLFRYFIDKYIAYNKRFNKEDLTLQKKRSIQLGSATIFETLFDGLIYSYIVYCGYIGEILIGNVMTYMKTVTEVKIQVISILETFSRMNQESMFIDQLTEYLNLPEDISPKDEEVVINRIERIDIRHLYYRYKLDQDYVLKDINLMLDRTDTIAVVGQNGSGKTTLLKILMGFYEDYEGEIFINGIELKRLSRSSLLKRIATVFQDFYKYEGTFRENIGYGNLSIMQKDEELVSICRKFDLENLIWETEERLDCQIGYWFDNGKQISLGQWQKLGLARAFAKDADLYIMDEANASLDAIAESRLADLYMELLDKKMGIVVAHKFNHLVKRVDRIVVLEQGQITGSGTHEELLESNETYKMLYKIQVG